VPDAAVPTLTLPGRIIQALLAGEQVIDLRRQPAGGGPPAGATRFWLRADPAADPELKPAYQRARELSVPDDEPPGPEEIRIDGWAELAGTASVVIDDKLREALNGKTILALDPFAGEEVLILALRAHRLVEPATVPAADLAGLTPDPAAGPASEPALSDGAFDARYNGLNGSLPGGLTPP
jgi:hypothetical protein